MTETVEQMHLRLLQVIAAAHFEILSVPYAWQPVRAPNWTSDALAFVRDRETWFALTTCPVDGKGSYRVFSFHFAEGSNASGFVAWLADKMKQRAGTGAMVVCGFDARATPALWQTSLGLFDYWGCPWAKGDEVISVVNDLRAQAAT